MVYAASVLSTAETRTVADLAGLLRALRRRQARRGRASAATYRELAARTGWSQTAIGEYLTGKTLPPVDRFDALVGPSSATRLRTGHPNYCGTVSGIHFGRADALRHVAERHIPHLDPARQLAAVWRAVARRYRRAASISRAIFRCFMPIRPRPVATMPPGIAISPMPVDHPKTASARPATGTVHSGARLIPERRNSARDHCCIVASTTGLGCG